MLKTNVQISSRFGLRYIRQLRYNALNMGQLSFDQAAKGHLFDEIVQSRRSTRRYSSRPIEKALLERLLEAARWAPSAHNRQPWRFCVVTGAENKQALSEAMGQQWERDLTADGTDREMVERRVAISRLRITSAAALLVVALSMEEMDIYPDDQRNQAEWVMAVQSTALACENLLLAAHSYGLGACWMCAPLFVPELVRSTLNLPEIWQPQALITLGYPMPEYPIEERIKIRAPIESRVVWR